MTDSIADMLTRIRNAYAVGKQTVDVPFSTVKEAIAKVLKAEEYISDFDIVEAEPQNIIRIKLMYVKDQPAITSIKRISKPGRRIYTPAKRLATVLSGLGIQIISTSQGVMTNNAAKSANLGGEILCEVW